MVLVAACTKPNPLSCLDGTCDDPRYPFCDVNGDIAGEPNTCIEGQCEPNAIAGCQGDDLVTCNANGTNFETAECEFGCQGTDAQASCNLCEPNTATCDGDSISYCGADGRVASMENCAGKCVADPEARCTHIVPRYLPNVCDSRASSDLEIENTASFDTNLDANCNGGIILQAGGPNICVVRHTKIVLAASAELRVVGNRALALVADEELVVDGYLNVSAGDQINGPGGGTMYSFRDGVGGAGDGLGGAGFAVNGGDGGTATADGGAVNGGLATADPATFTVLVGGPQAGNGSSTLVVGGGGGAATLVACRGRIAVHGEINAGGGGGLPTLFFTGGGGAGGYVVLQGFAIEVDGKLFANGGGGAGGKSLNGLGVRGSDGSRGLSPATGGYVVDGGPGGDGGTGTALPKNGKKRNAGGGIAGGGGGSVGFFQTYTPVGVDPVITPSMASPTPRPNANIPTD